jgi:hypothetical protein
MQWPDETFDGLFVDCVLASELEPMRGDLVRSLWHRNPDAAWELGLRSMEGHAPPSVGAQVAALTAHDPPSGSEALFRWAVDHAGGRSQAHSMIALEHLGYDGPEWRRRLAELVEEGFPALRFNARAALGRRGDDSWLEEVVGRAEQDASESVRSEALHALGDADPERFLPVLGRSFLEGHSPDDVCCSPGAEAASYELARWGSPDAMTIFVRGFFRVTTSCLFGGVVSHLQAFEARRPGWWDVSPYGRFNRPSVRDRTVLSHLSWLNSHNP